MRSGETVLVTAAAGGTGQFAVQLAKAAGNRIVATCGGAKKAELLRRLGVDRVIDYHKEDVKSVLKSEFPNVCASRVALIERVPHVVGVERETSFFL